jgi:hypothetical protein
VALEIHTESMRASGAGQRFAWAILERCRTDPAAPDESRVKWDVHQDLGSD